MKINLNLMLDYEKLENLVREYKVIESKDIRSALDKITMIELQQKIMILLKESI